MKVKIILIVLVIAIWSGAGLFPVGQSIKETKHNLSVSGPGTYKSANETEVCKFCHTPHSAKPKQPLWNHQLSAVRHYKTYQSATLEALSSGQSLDMIDGNSRLCLGCHDGTVALGAMVNSKNKGRSDPGLGPLPPSSRGYRGTDLSGSHPISMGVSKTMIARNNSKDTLLNSLHEMKSDPDVRLDENNKVQCTSCHDVHSDKNHASSGIHFWAKPTFSDVCLVCHRL